MAGNHVLGFFEDFVWPTRLGDEVRIPAIALPGPAIGLVGHSPDMAGPVLPRW